MKYELKRLNVNDGDDVYEMLQEIPKDENGFINSINGKTFEEYKQWLVKSDISSKAKGLEEGWKVPTNIYWLYIDGKPVGMVKLRHFLTDKLREEGGHAGYGIRPSERNKGYGTILLKILVEEAKKMNIEKILLTIRNENTYSVKVALSNNGKIEKSNEERQYVWIDC
jgi:predicted acetyltransferase